MIAIASDHGGFGLKEMIKAHLTESGIEFIDCGTEDNSSCSYADYAHKLCKKLQDGEARLGVLVCGTGIGMSMAANKHRGIRAAVCGDYFSAKFTRKHNDANVLCLGARVTGPGLALELVDVFLETEFEGGRHAERVAQVMGFEESER